MKPLYLLFTFIILNSSIMYAQSEGNAEKTNKHNVKYRYKDTLNFYLKLSGGHTFILSPTNISYHSGMYNGQTGEYLLNSFTHSLTTINDPQGDRYTTYDNINISLGKGNNIYGSIGYQIDRRVNIEAGGGYVWGSVFTAHQISRQYLNDVFVAEGAKNKKLFSRMLNFDLSITIHAIKNRWKPFLKLGSTLYIPKIYLKEIVTNNTICYAGYDEISWNFFGGYGIGGIASGGVTYKLTTAIDIYTEIKITSLSYAPLNGVMTKFVVNGVNKVDSLPKEESNISFSDTHNNAPSGVSSIANGKALKYHFPFSSWGVNVGVKYNFTKHYYRKKKTAE